MHMWRQRTFDLARWVGVLILFFYLFLFCVLLSCYYYYFFQVANYMITWVGVLILFFYLFLFCVLLSCYYYYYFQLANYMITFLTIQISNSPNTWRNNHKVRNTTIWWQCEKPTKNDSKRKIHYKGYYCPKMEIHYMNRSFII